MPLSPSIRVKYTTVAPAPPIRYFGWWAFRDQSGPARHPQRTAFGADLHTRAGSGQFSISWGPKVTNEPFTVAVTTIYALSMPKYVFVKLVGTEEETRVEGDTVEETGSDVTIKRAGVISAKYYKPNVQGWRLVEGS
jgi:hypothetical protein